ncbi:hypothetical protein [Methylomagnum sp.]
MNMLSVIQMSAPPGPIPDGMKVVAFTGPNTFDPAPCPVLAIGSFILWPMSYIDNRVSFGMVMYDPQGQVLNQVEKPGARYVYKIALDGSGASGSVTFSGQADQTVTMTLDEACQLMVV